jgi:hypothetical protein
VKVSADPLLAETVPDGTFGGARPRRARERTPQRRGPDPDAARHLAELAAEVAAIDKSRGYGVNTRYRTATTERNAA